MRAIKTTMRTRSGGVHEKLVYISEEDATKLEQEGGKSDSARAEVLAKYVSRKELKRLAGVDLKQQKALRVQLRDADGAVVERVLHVSESDLERVHRGELDVATLAARDRSLADVVRAGGRVERAAEAEGSVQPLRVTVRTESGGTRERTLLVDQRDRERLERQIAETGDAGSLLAQMAGLRPGEAVQHVGARPERAASSRRKPNSGEGEPHSNFVRSNTPATGAGTLLFEGFFVLV